MLAAFSSNGTEVPMKKVLVVAAVIAAALAAWWAYEQYLDDDRLAGERHELLRSAKSVCNTSGPDELSSASRELRQSWAGYVAAYYGLESGNREESDSPKELAVAVSAACSKAYGVMDDARRATSGGG